LHLDKSENELMKAIKINVNKQMDGYTFSILPSVRDLIKKSLPGAMPANSISVGYDLKTDFETYIGKLERLVFPALLGVNNDDEIKEFEVIEFIDSKSGKTLKTFHPSVEKI